MFNYNCKVFIFSQFDDMASGSTFNTMWKTILALLVTIIVIPFLAFRFDQPLTGLQNQILFKLVVVYLAAALLCFVVSSLSKNYSQMGLILLITLPSLRRIGGGSISWFDGIVAVLLLGFIVVETVADQQ